MVTCFPWGRPEEGVGLSHWGAYGLWVVIDNIVIYQ